MSHDSVCMQADFSFFFDTGGRRRCYIAPERFYESSSSNLEQISVQRLQPEMVCLFPPWLCPCSFFGSACSFAIATFSCPALSDE